MTSIDGPAVDGAPSETVADPKPLTRGGLYVAYATGPVSHGMSDMLAVVVPLLALSLGFSPTEIGILVGVRNVLPMLLGIHSGVMMDRFGVRRVLFFVALVAATLSPLYPLMPWFPALVMLQLLTGFATNTGYVGAQVLIGSLTHGGTGHFGRLIFVTRLGAFFSPIAIGAIWDFFGALGAFSFISLWGICLIALACIAPEPELTPAKPSTSSSIRDLLPRISDYRRSFALLAMPAVALSVLISLLRSTTGAIQESFYLVHLETLGLSGTIIGLLIALVGLSSSIGSLSSGKFVEWIRPHWLMISFAVCSILLITITPLLGGVMAFLVLAQLLRGGFQGIMTPVTLSIISKAVGPESQGISMSLRMTATRTAMTIVPIIMGIIADIADITTSFYIVGGSLIAILAVTAVIVSRSSAFDSRTSNEDQAL